MKAMILAAGLGTRLRPLTNDRPKALVEAGGHTLLELALLRLRSFGVSDVIINVHRYADMIVQYLKANDNFGMNLAISREDVLLDTGGGLKNASDFFLESGCVTDEPFILHNVDVLSTIDLERMIRFHRNRKSLATLAVQGRITSRYLLFDMAGLLCGRRAGIGGVPELARPVSNVTALAFSGIHVISTRLFEKICERGTFSIIASYLRLASQLEKIAAFSADEYYWRDLGKPESVAQATLDIKNGIYPCY